MARIVVDRTSWPIVRVQLPPAATDDEVRAYLDDLAVPRARKRPYALIIVAERATGFTPKQRRMQADYIDPGNDPARRYLKAFAFVARSTLQRGMLTAVFWLRPPEWPHQVFGTWDEAQAWVKSILERSSSDQH